MSLSDVLKRDMPDVSETAGRVCCQVYRLLRLSSYR